MANRVRRNVSLTEDVEDMLKRVGTGNISNYVNQVIRDRWQEWQGAFFDLLSEGWTKNEIWAACMEHALIINKRRTATVHLCTDGQLSEEGMEFVQRYDLHPEHWHKQLLSIKENMISSNGKISTDERLWWVVREYLAGNEELEKKLRGGG